MSDFSKCIINKQNPQIFKTFISKCRHFYRVIFFCSSTSFFSSLLYSITLLSACLSTRRSYTLRCHNVTTVLILSKCSEHLSSLFTDLGYEIKNCDTCNLFTFWCGLSWHWLFYVSIALILATILFNYIILYHQYYRFLLHLVT